MGTNIKLGSYVGNWLVVSDRYKKENGRLYYNDCRCVCGAFRAIQHSQLTHYLTKSCGCQNPTRFHGTAEGGLSLSYYNHCRRSAQKRGIEFADDISMKYLHDLFEDQNGMCIYSGVPITLNPRFASQCGKTKNMKDAEIQTASLDRIDSSKGYIKGNLQWVHKQINTMKNNISSTSFIDWCEKVSNHVSKAIN